MEDKSLRKLVHFMLLKDFPDLEEMPSTDASLPPIMLTKRFSQRMGMVMKTKRMVIYCRYGGVVDKSYLRMCTSHEMYLRYVMFVLQKELECFEDVFDNFLSVCAVLFIMSTNALLKTGINFSDLNLDIFMVFYQGMMHERFKKAGGLQKFAKFILDHMYHKIDPRQLREVDELFNDGTTKLQNAIKKKGFEFEVEHDEIEKDTTSLCLATNVLSETKVTLPTLLTKRELIEKVVADNQAKMEKEAEAKPKKEAEAKPKKEAEGKPKKEAEGKPKKEAEGKPGKEAEEKPEKEAEGKPKKETASKFDYSKKVLEKPVTSNEDSRIQTGESKAYQVDNEDISKFIMKYKSDKKIGNEAEQKEHRKQNKGIVHPVMRSSSNTDSNTNYEAEQKKDKVEGYNVEAAIMSHSNSDSKTNSEADKKEDNVDKMGIVEAAVVAKSNLEPATNYEADQKENNSKNDVIIQKIMAYNCSENASLVKSDMLQKVAEIFHYLKKTIQSLIQVLDEYDEE